MQGPYRTRIVPPETDSEFWTALERRRAGQRRLKRLVFVAVLAPAASVPVWTAFASAETPARAPLERAVVTPMTEPFGLAVTPTDSAPLRGALPPGVPRPDLEPGTATVAGLQALIQEQAGAELARCYAAAQQRDPKLAGELVVSVAVGVDRAPMAVVTGDTPARAALSACLAPAFEAVSYPRPRHEALWFHYPVRFSAHLP